ncbi:MAG: signal recognition particle-docking protein FtsY, partial [Mesorhizobium sp.]
KAPPSVLPDISPSRGEIGSPPLSPISNAEKGTGRPSCQSPPLRSLEGEMSGRTEGGAAHQDNNHLKTPPDRRP